jgi:hypothetical protein
MAKHSMRTPTAGGTHVAIRYRHPDAAARAALTLVTEDVGSLALQEDSERLLGLVRATPTPRWIEIPDLAEVLTLLAAKADVTALTGGLALKADQSAVTSALALKVDVSALAQALALKADQATLDALTALVGGKANQAALDALLLVVDGKANQAAVDALITALGTKADAANTNAALLTKLDTATFDAAIALKADAADLTTGLAGKADKSAHDALAAAFAALVVVPVDDFEALEALVATKADQSALTAGLALKADKAAHDALAAQVADLEAGEGGVSQAEFDALEAEVGTKAAQSAVDAVNAALGGKANTTDVTAALALKADQAALTAGLSGKASQADLDALEGVVGTKLGAADLAAKADKNVTIQTLAGSGLSGGGDLSQNRALVADVKSIFGRIGNILSEAGDYAASQISNDSAVTGASVKDALLFLRDQIAAVPSQAISTVFGRAGAIVAQAADYAAFYVPLTRTISTGSGLSGGGDLSANRTLTADVRTVHGRTGLVVSETGDYAASQVTNDSTQVSPATYPTVAAAIDRLATLIAGATGAVSSVFGRSGAIVALASDYAAHYVPLTRTISPGAGLSGGGDLSANRTLTADVQTVFGRVGAVVAQAADYAAHYVPLARTVTAGAGLGGGGALSGNITLTANVTSVFGRTGAITGAASDIANDSTGFAPGTYATLAAVLNQIATALSGKVDTSTYTAGLAAKADRDFVINWQNGPTYTLTVSDIGKLIICNSAAAFTLYVPTNVTAAIPNGAVVAVMQWNAGQVTIAAATPGTTTFVSSTPAPYRTAAQYGADVILKKVQPEIWVVSGGLA